MSIARPVRVVVADDQAAVREGLVIMLDLLDDVEVVGQAADGDEAVRLVEERQPDVVLMDLRMPRCDGVTATGRIRAAHPSTQVVVLTTYSDEADIITALRAGALGFLTKDATRAQIAQAVRAADTGQSIIAGEVQQKLVAAAGPIAPQAVELPDGLTAREVEVLRLIAEGLANKEIAARLYVSEATVKSHINRLFAKAGITHRAQAVQYAYEHGLVVG
jgi:DNA-binding NarL/FixJ family response regulator